MKRLLIASVACLALASGAAVAADMPLKAPVFKAPVVTYSWTGCYVGANAGFDWARTSSHDSLFGTDYGNEDDEFLAGGGQVGCDYQFAPSWVVGLRGNYDWTQLNNGTEVVPGTLTTADMNIHWTATATARIGYLYAPQLLLYVQGGGAWTRNNLQVASLTAPFGVLNSGSNNVTGFTVGAGAEYMVVQNLSFFVEGNYMGFGTHNIATTVLATGAPGATWSTKEYVAQFLVGVNLRFGNWGGPVVARY